jgi:membrane associated rhomboid family serine protease
MTLLVFLILLSQVVYLLPIRDRRSRRLGFPWMTLSLVVINVLVHIFVVVATSGSDEESWVLLYPYMEVPRLILDGQGLGALSVLTSGFLHGGWWHLAGNMFILWFFGRKVEDATGSFRFALLYIFCLYTSSLLSVISRGAFASTAEGMIPGLGASGAIFGIMAAYLFLYSDQRILTLILPIPWPFWIPAWIYIVRELLLNALVGQLVQEGSLVVRVNVFAHLGGAAGGLLFIYFFLHPDVFAQRR